VEGTVRHWTKDEKRRLAERWGIDSMARIAADLDRMPGQVRAKAQQMGLLTGEARAVFGRAAAGFMRRWQSREGGRRGCTRAGRLTDAVWSPEIEDELIQRWLAHQHHQAIARDMGLSEAAVRSKATRLGLPQRVRADIVQGWNPP
jgi:hypothetical protein